MRFIFIILIGIAFVGCSRDNEVAETIILEDSVIGVKEVSEQPKIDITTETRHAFIKKVVTYESVLYIIVDYADYFTGEEAAKMEWRDKAYFVDSGDTITNITDGYYISNMNNKLRTFKAQEGISIELIRTDTDVYDLEEKKIGSELQLRAYMGDENLIVLHIEDGIVTGIEEQFRP